MNRRFRLGAAMGCLALAAIGLSTGPAKAASWQKEMSRQILRDLNCEIAFMSQVKERTVDGRRVIMAKVHCKDKRSFDALRGSDNEAFQFKACEVPNAEAC